ncbi:DEAD/DEAH box helicase [Enterococcus casseliflavus]|uniref:DEAD/DEAH box helicase n=1 Tax=Enterococcus casseliflavus TaxID=37734 RepID=UPI002DBF8AD1|nr:DEAD/DEAH box helicase [Enterococcus casseliflavus]MEB6146575.1 DEAD/DEAH box helicase [Enterococcus casseliflavus]
MSSNVCLRSIGGTFTIIDNNEGILTTRKVKRLLERYQSFFQNFDQLILSKELNYVQLTELITKLNDKIDGKLEIDEEIRSFIEQSQYAIDEQRIVGITIKEYDSRWDFELQQFKDIIDQEISRPLKSQQVQASFYLATMKRAANFSVPGAGKTAMTYGAFAYLSSPTINEINKMIVISPLNAFEAWRTEFVEVFGDKRTLHFMNLKNFDNPGEIRTNWGIANVIVINYESLLGWRLSVLNTLIDEETMIVFDEVHRIKNPAGKRAKNALSFGKHARYHYVLSGTPIPNSYKDIYNFLHILYKSEYESFFGWDIHDLAAVNANEINEKLQPFFWRTTKKDLNVPEAEPDQLFVIQPNGRQADLAKTIHEVETNILGRYIRLLQASTNPALLAEKINLNDIGFLLDEIDYSIESALDGAEQSKAKQSIYLNAGVETMVTPKFIAGLNLIEQLVSEGKKVIVWGIFVGTMQKIFNRLREKNILSHMIYGQTPKEDRAKLINEFRNGPIQVLISNPATLGESISLHQSVHDAVYFEYNFNLTFMLQSRDRIHRLGLDGNQYTRYYYLMTDGDRAHGGFIDQLVYERLKEKEAVMINAIEGDMLLPEVEDDYLEDVKKIITKVKE